MAKAINDQEYYEDKDHWGENQFVTLKSIIDNIRITADDDSYFKHIKNFRASIFGKLAIKKFNVDVKSEDKAISIQLPPTLIFPFPRYMTNWYRVGVINSCGKLTVLNINNNPTTHDYLQDHEWELLYDDEGNVLRGADFDAQKGDCCCCLTVDCVETCNCSNCSDCSCESCTNCQNTQFKNSWVKENKEGSYFEFSDDLSDEIIVIEFQTAGLDSLEDCDIKVHHNLEDTVTRFIQWNLIMGKRNVPQAQVDYYEDLLKKARKRSENLLAKKITIDQILKSISLRYS